MKLNLKKKIKLRSRDEEEDDAPVKRPKMGDSSWMIQGRDELNRAKKKQETEARNNRRAPELYFRDGDEKRVRFRTNEAVGCFRYRLKVGGKWIQKTQPLPGERDMFREAGLSPTLQYCYEVIDINGYVDSAKKKIKNVPRFLWVSGKVEKQLDKMRDKRGPLTKYDIEISRTGSGTDTTYSLFPDDPSAPTEVMKKADKLMPQFEEYYRPPTVEEQRLMVAGVAGHEDEEEERPRKRRERDEDESF